MMHEFDCRLTCDLYFSFLERQRGQVSTFNIIYCTSYVSIYLSSIGLSKGGQHGSPSLRILFSDAFYHVTARGNERKAVFKNKRDRVKFLEYLESANERYHAVIHAYCLMGNHYHLLLQTPVGHLFQGRYKAIVVEKDEYAKELSRYIHLNPVRAKMVQKPEQYTWTSYRCYVGKEKAPPWLQCQFILNYFGRLIGAAQKGYQQYVSQLVSKDYESPLKGVFGSALLGSQSFIDFKKNEFISTRKSDRNVPALKRLANQATLADICQAVESVFGETPRTSPKH